MRAPRRGVTLRPWVLREGRAWAGSLDTSLPPRVREGEEEDHPSLLEEDTMREVPEERPPMEKVGVEEDMLAMMTPMGLVASRWKV